jgi:hypothetical protein
MLAAAARSAAVLIILGWLAVSNPERGLAFAWVLGTAAVFLVTGLTQFWLYFRGLAPPVAAYLFILVDSLALAAVLLLPNPYVTPELPPATPLRYASFMYFFVLLMQAAFSFRPRLLLWTGLCAVGAWAAGFTWIVTRPGIITDPPGATGRGAMLADYFDPNYASILKFQNEVIVFLLVSAGLALLVIAVADDEAALMPHRPVLHQVMDHAGPRFAPVMILQVTLDGAGRNSSLRTEPVENQLSVTTQRLGHFLHRTDFRSGVEPDAYC